MKNYQNRTEAGALLSPYLEAYKDRDTLILALPRGGVPVAFEIAKNLNLPMDILIVRKLGVPFHSELAMGAIASGKGLYLNQELIANLHISDQEIQTIIARERQELERREKVYRGQKPFPNLHGKTIILVDDGMATGATMRAAIQTLQGAPIQAIVIAVPVAAADTCKAMESLADTVICPLQPENFEAVGLWYQDFKQTTDAEVITLLQGDTDGHSKY